MQSGDFTRKIIIGKMQVTTNENGFQENNFVGIINTWSQINGISNREFYSSNTTDAESILNFKIRYRKNINESMQIFYNNKFYNITGIDDYMEQHQFLTLRARVVEQSG